MFLRIVLSSCCRRGAACSPIKTQSVVLPVVTRGMVEASATQRPSTPETFNSPSTNAQHVSPLLLGLSFGRSGSNPLGRIVGISDLCLRVWRYGVYAGDAPGSVLISRQVFTDGCLNCTVSDSQLAPNHSLELSPISQYQVRKDFPSV